MDSTVKTFFKLNGRLPVFIAVQMYGRKHYLRHHPFKESANIVKTQLKDLSVKLQASFVVSNQSRFMSRKIVQEFRQAKQSLSSLIEKKWIVYNFKCDQCDACYVGNTRGDLFLRVDGHESKTLSVHKH